jgi:DNA-binding phage protein
MGKIQNTLNAAFKTGDLATICLAIDAMIFATDNVSAFALKAGVGRAMLYRAFKNHNPRLNLVLRVLSAADFKLVVIDHPKFGTKPSLISKRLSGAFETAEITLITKALSENLRAQKNVVTFSEKANLNRVSLYRSFTAPRVPTLATVLSFLNALRLRLAVIGVNDSVRDNPAARTRERA